jgi:hypothetical protein
MSTKGGARVNRLNSPDIKCAPTITRYALFFTQPATVTAREYERKGKKLMFELQKKEKKIVRLETEKRLKPERREKITYVTLNSIESPTTREEV